MAREGPAVLRLDSPDAALVVHLGARELSDAGNKERVPALAPGLRRRHRKWAGREETEEQAAAADEREAEANNENPTTFIEAVEFLDFIESVREICGSDLTINRYMGS